MNARAAAVMLLLLVAPLAAFDKRIEVDPTTDFSVLRTFALRAGVASSRNPEINNALTLKRVEEMIRATLLSRGMTETPDPGADLVVTFSVTEGGQRGAPPPGQRGAVRLSAGTMIIDMTRRDTTRLVWRGIYSDAANRPATLADRLPGQAKQLLKDFPPKKK
jgi:hypothetical protein